MGPFNDKKLRYLVVLHQKFLTQLASGLIP